MTVDRKKCITCDSPLQGNWCHNCGEKVLHPSDNTVLHYIKEVLGELLGTDSRLYRTVLALAIRPGYLTAQYLTGRRRPFAGPVALFLLMNVLFFLMQPLANINTFNSTLHAQTHWYPYSDWAQEIVDQSLTTIDLDHPEYERLYNLKSEGFAKSLIFIQIPILALGVMLLRLPRPGNYFRHLVFATHVYCAILLLNIVLSAGVYLYWQVGGNEFNFQIPMLLAFAIYFSVAMRGAYGDSWTIAVIRGLITLLLLTGVLFVYRMLLLLVTVQAIALV